MSPAPACPTPLSVATPFTIDGFLPFNTNLLLRLADSGSKQHSIAVHALVRLLGQGDEVYITPQNLIEFWAVATRPQDANGFGWSRERTAQEVSDLFDRFPILQDSYEVLRTGSSS